MPARIKKNDNIVVVAGKDKGRRGTVLKVLPDRDRVIVGGVNVVKRHQKQQKGQSQGGIVEKEAPIHISNVMIVDTKSDKPTRIRTGLDKDSHKVRIAVKSGTVLDK
jgi:large subunit ribosomal protein L24